ncbi:MAG TPA: phosphodiester glycosidase family protein [Nocardioidaceae bacterium]|nr:phosphodiester glycosidase family protein [Nocardioidaceae bacterium]
MTSPLTRPRTAALLLGTAALVAPFAALHGSGPADAAGDTAATAGPRLDLGPADLPESRTTTRLQPGVTLTRITRGGDDPSLHWTLEALVPATSSSPDPDAPPRSVTDRASADAEADRLRSKGFPARVEEVDQPATADVPAGVLGYRVRVGSYPTQQDADADKARLAAAGESATSVYTGWDGSATDRGPWHVDVVRIDPQAFRGRLRASYGPDLHDRETTSSLAQAAGATVGVNGGFFVLDPAAGAPGDPAGVGVYGGRVLSEPTDGRAALVLHDDGTRTAVDRVTWAGHVTVGGRSLPLDGTNRVPGLIRNCGGDASDQPTSQPLHDTTCTDDSELVSFTRAYGASTPSGDGREVLVDAAHHVRQVLDHRGATLPAGWSSVQATGAKADELGSVQVGQTMAVTPALRGADGASYHPTASTTLVNGGPVLVREGHEDITQKQDGFVHPGDPSFAYGWFVKRNPRTFAGVDAQGRTVIVTVDGRSTRDLGLSIPEAADVARSLGLRDAINLDGGGSTTLAVDGKVVSHPSDSTGERPVGDALLVTPSR